MTERVLTQDEVRLPQDEVRDLTDEEADQVSGGALPFALALHLWILSQSTHGTSKMTF